MTASIKPYRPSFILLPTHFRGRDLLIKSSRFDCTFGLLIRQDQVLHVTQYLVRARHYEV